MTFKVPEEYRVTKGNMATTADDGRNGLFEFRKGLVTYYCVVSDKDNWEHVAITIDRTRPPRWPEMHLVKNMFWDESDIVMQFHPANQEYLNNNVYCLHLYRPIGIYFPAPPAVVEGVPRE